MNEKIFFLLLFLAWSGTLWAYISTNKLNNYQNKEFTKKILNLSKQKINTNTNLQTEKLVVNQIHLKNLEIKKIIK